MSIKSILSFVKFALLYHANLLLMDISVIPILIYFIIRNVITTSCGTNIRVIKITLRESMS